MDVVSPGADYLEVLIRSREKIYYSGRALSLSSYNDKGAFDVLPKHANFISMIEKSITVLPNKGTPTNIKIDGKSVLKVNKNNIQVFLGL